MFFFLLSTRRLHAAWTRPRVIFFDQLLSRFDHNYHIISLDDYSLQMQKFLRATRGTFHLLSRAEPLRGDVKLTKS